jgi:hypothetical protein
LDVSLRGVFEATLTLVILSEAKDLLSSFRAYAARGSSPGRLVAPRTETALI